MATTPSFPATPRVGSVQLTSSTTINTNQTIIAGGTNGTKITALFATSTDSSTRDIFVQLVRATTQAGTYPLTYLTVAALAGDSNTVPLQNVFANMGIGMPIDNDGQPYLFLQTGDSLVVSVPVALTSAKLLSVIAIGADF